MWGPDGELHDTKMVIPDRCYSTMYAEIVEDCKVPPPHTVSTSGLTSQQQANGAFDVTKMGNVANVGLMAQKAEEYGSHDKTFEMKSAGMVRVVNNEVTFSRPLSRTPDSRGFRMELSCSRPQWDQATSSACARSRTPQSKTGSSLLLLVHGSVIDFLLASSRWGLTLLSGKRFCCRVLVGPKPPA